jgi:hypothetical protein
MAYDKTYMDSYRSLRRANGLCIECPNKSDRFLRCATCRLKLQAYKKKKRQSAVVE